MNKLLKIIIIICGSIGTGLSLFSDGYDFYSLLYFTTLSNLSVVIVTALFLHYESSNKEIPSSWHAIRYMVTAAIALTFVVFNATLMPEMIKDGKGMDLLKMSNVLNHNVTPILMVIDFVLYGKKIPTSKIHYALFLPLGYFIITIFLNPIFGITYGSSKEVVPYFFLNYQKNGWFSLQGGFFGIGVIYWILMVLSIVFLIGYGIYGLRKLNKNDYFL